MISKDIKDIENPSQIVDIRRPSEWMDTGVIDGAHLLTYEGVGGAINPLFVSKMSEIFKKDEPIFLMCYSATRSKNAAKILTNAGFSSVGEIRGGAFYQNKIGAKFSEYKG